MTERRKLSLGNVSERERSGDSKRAWKVSPARAETLKQRARDMRRDPTPAQTALWERLKDKQLGIGFNREVVMGSAIVDFACKPRWLVIETGGTDGAAATIAELSDRKLREVGVRVLRFAEEQVLTDIELVLAAISDELAKPFERPGGKATAR
jgi:leucyl-tRNA synthetase